MNVNEVAIPQYKPSEVTILQDKSKSIINERVMSQHVQYLKQLCLKTNHHLKNQSSMSGVCLDVEYRVERLYLQ